MHPMLWTRPDLAFAVSTLGQFSSDPSDVHWKVGMDVLRYVRGTLDLALIFHGSDTYELVGYADSDWAADKQTGKSMFGYAFFMGGSLVSWKCKKSQTVATSSTVAEIEALYNAITEGIWISNLLESIGIENVRPFLVYQDNQAVIAIVTGERVLERTKHEIVKIEFIRSKIQDGTAVVKYKETALMTADIFTKSLGKNLFGDHVKGLGMEVLGNENEGECGNVTLV